MLEITALLEKKRRKFYTIYDFWRLKSSRCFAIIVIINGLLLQKIAATNNPIVLSRIDEDSIKASVSCIDGLRKVDYSIMEEEDFANHFLYLSINSGRIIEVDTDKLDSVMNELHKFREEVRPLHYVFLTF